MLVGYILSRVCLKCSQFSRVPSLSSLHYNGHRNVMCSTDSYLADREYIFVTLHYYHHQIRSMNHSHCCYICPWLCVWGGCVLSVASYRSRKRWRFATITLMCSLWRMQIIGCYSLKLGFVSVHTTLLHYHHYRGLSVSLKHMNTCQIYSVECVSKIKFILSIIFYAVYGAV